MPYNLTNTIKVFDRHTMLDKSDDFAKIDHSASAKKNLSNAAGTVVDVLSQPFHSAFGAKSAFGGEVKPGFTNRVEDVMMATALIPLGFAFAGKDVVDGTLHGIAHLMGKQS